ncbi:MAG: hypothetical protein AAEJ46_12400, partial [Planctomycetota bacterium]
MRILFLAAMMTMPAGLCAQAVNDECNSATVAVIGTNAIDTTEATNSPEEIPTSTCPGTALGGVHSDVWFYLTPAEDG